MIRGVNTNTVEVAHAPLSGFDGITTGAAALDAEGDMEVGVWEHSVGISTDTEVEEVFVVLAGSGKVTCDRGGEIILEPGVVGLLPSGAKTQWPMTLPAHPI